jgi:hypothetical protein
VPLNKVWFLTYFCLYLFLYISYRLYTYLFITSIVHTLVNSSQLILHRIFIYFHINTLTHSYIHTSTYPHIQGSISTGKTRQCVEIVEVRKPLLQNTAICGVGVRKPFLQEDSVINLIATNENNVINHIGTRTVIILPQEGTAQGSCFYGGGGILPVAIVFIVFLCSIVMWSTTIVTFVTIATITTFIFTGWHGGTTYTEISPLRGKGCICHPLKIQQEVQGFYFYGGEERYPLPPAWDW